MLQRDGDREAKETDMKTLRLFALAALAIVALLALGGCTDQSTRAILTVQSVNDGNVYFSDLVNEADSTHIFIPVDVVPMTLGNIQNDGGVPLAAGTPFSDITLTSYSVTFDNGIFTPVNGGLAGHVASGGTTDVSIVLTNSSEKGALLGTLGGSTVTTTARITVRGFVQANGANNGEPVVGIAALTVQVGNFGDSDVNQ
jgi:hypothetical protein